MKRKKTPTEKTDADWKSEKEAINKETDEFCNSCPKRGNCPMIDLQGFERRTLCYFARRGSSKNKAFSTVELATYLYENRQ